MSIETQTQVELAGHTENDNGAVRDIYIKINAEHELLNVQQAADLLAHLTERVNHNGSVHSFARGHYRVLRTTLKESQISLIIRNELNAMGISVAS